MTKHTVEEYAVMNKVQLAGLPLEELANLPIDELAKLVPVWKLEHMKFEKKSALAVVGDGSEIPAYTSEQIVAMDVSEWNRSLPLVAIAEFDLDEIKSMTTLSNFWRIEREVLNARWTVGKTSKSRMKWAQDTELTKMGARYEDRIIRKK